MKAVEKGEKLRMVECMLENVRVAIAKQAAKTGEDADTDTDLEPKGKKGEPKPAASWIDDDED